MEDLDPPRESPKAATQILHALETLNLYWDGEVLYQSQRYSAYQNALTLLQMKELIFPCTCSRLDMQEHAGIYPGTCRKRNINYSDLDAGQYSLRCKVSNLKLQFDDLLQGVQDQNLESKIGDFIIKRKDGLYSYQLAVVIDDAFQEITHIIRGIDLLDSSHRQIYLQLLLNYPQPVYGHIPVIINAEGQKLSKQHHATPVQLKNPPLTLYQALHYLQQNPPSDLKNSTPADILLWAVEHWQIQKLHNLHQLDENQFALSG